jgi:hypothetical protein
MWLPSQCLMPWLTVLCVEEYGGCEVPDPQDLVTISQSRCSASDLTRMEAILASKLATSKQVSTKPNVVNYFAIN